MKINVKVNIRKWKKNQINCFCKVICEYNKVCIESDKVICILQGSVFTDEEWKEYETKVKLEMDLE